MYLQAILHSLLPPPRPLTNNCSIIFFVVLEIFLFERQALTEVDTFLGALLNKLIHFIHKCSTSIHSIALQTNHNGIHNRLID